MDLENGVEKKHSNKLNCAPASFVPLYTLRTPDKMHNGDRAFSVP